jgi:adenylosuccinate lyase
MKELWSENEKFKRWLEVEIAVVEAYEKLGIAPAGTSQEIKKKAIVNVDRIKEIEKVVDHDVIAFIKSITENMGEEANYFHLGLTSSDVIDTALGLTLKKAVQLIIEALEKLIDSLRKLAIEHKYTPIVGRTHGVHAEPTSFGLKVLSWYSEALRNHRRLKNALNEVAVMKISGAVGNYANISPEVEKIVSEILGLEIEKVSTQIVPRDRIAYFLNVLSLVAAGIERIALEIRLLQRTEVLELQEPFKKGQRGSSAMPHKKNPILCERLCGMARLLRSYSQAAMENIALWHERDISHSSVERVVLPDATNLIYYMLVKADYLIQNLVVNIERMKRNFMVSYNLVFSQRVMLKLIEKGLSREQAYLLVQKNALRSWEEEVDFKSILENDPEILDVVNKDELSELFDIGYYLRNVDKIYERFGL